MQTRIKPNREALLYLSRKVKTLFQKKEPIPQEVQAVLQECTTVEQLLDLLFATDFHKDNAFMEAFERRMNEIDPPF